MSEPKATTGCMRRAGSPSRTSARIPTLMLIGPPSAMPLSEARSAYWFARFARSRGRRHQQPDRLSDDAGGAQDVAREAVDATPGEDYDEETGEDAHGRKSGEEAGEDGAS